jgi:hypothetical protein
MLAAAASTERASALAAEPRPRKAWPWWLIAAHVSLPVATLATLYYLRANGYLPGLDR